MSKATTTIAAAEVWIPQENGDSLSLEDRIVSHGQPNADALARNGATLGIFAEQAINSRSPQISRIDDQSVTDNLSACAVTIPCYANDQLSAVLALNLQFPSDARGASEIWTRNERDELGLSESYYSNLELIARISPHVKFPRAAGLPGQTWDTRTAKLVGKLESDPNFMRASAAKTDGLSVGLALPVMHSEFDLSDVLVFLSSSSSPLANIIELWKPTEDNSELFCDEVACGPYVDWKPSASNLRIQAGMDIAGQVLEKQIPMVFDKLPELRSKRGSLSEQYNFNQAISFPVFVGKEINAIINLIF